MTRKNSCADSYSRVGSEGVAGELVGRAESAPASSLPLPLSAVARATPVASIPGCPRVFSETPAAVAASVKCAVICRSAMDSSKSLEAFVGSRA